MACNNLPYTFGAMNNICKEDSFGGIKEVLIADYDDVTVTVDSTSAESSTHMVSAITMASGATFQQYKLLKNTGSLTSTLNTSDTSASYFINEVILQFMKMETKKRIEIMALMMRPCVCIVLDANNKYWYLGMDNYVDCSAGSAQTGTNSSDPNHYELTLTDTSAELPFEVPAALLEGIVTDAA